MFLRDTPELNRLIRKEESDDEDLQFYLDMAIDDWNSSAPVIAYYDIGNFPSLYLLMHGAAIQAMKSQGLQQARNQLSYQSGGSSFMRSDKTQIYMAWCTNFANEYELKKRSLKIFQNIGNGYGGVSSEYARIGYSW